MFLAAAVSASLNLPAAQFQESPSHLSNLFYCVSDSIRFPPPLQGPRRSWLRSLPRDLPSGRREEGQEVQRPGIKHLKGGEAGRGKQNTLIASCSCSYFCFWSCVVALVAAIGSVDVAAATASFETLSEPHFVLKWPIIFCFHFPENQPPPPRLQERGGH